VAIIVAIWLTRVNPRALASNPYALPHDCPVHAGFTAVEGGRVWYEIVGRGDHSLADSARRPGVLVNGAVSRRLCELQSVGFSRALDRDVAVLKAALYFPRGKRPHLTIGLIEKRFFERSAPDGTRPQCRYTGGHVRLQQCALVKCAVSPSLAPAPAIPCAPKSNKNVSERRLNWIEDRFYGFKLALQTTKARRAQLSWYRLPFRPVGVLQMRQDQFPAPSLDL
jgi:hypothetical protein